LRCVSARSREISLHRASVSLAAEIGHVIHTAAWLGQRQAFDEEALVNASGAATVSSLGRVQMLADWQIDYLAVPRRPTSRCAHRGLLNGLEGSGLAIPSPADR
jgi:hypothetical protein